MAILIKKAGILDTLQDLGRTGFRKFGINPNGAMDKIAIRLINTLLGMPENETVLEMHFPAPELEFRKDTVFVIGGANLFPKVNNKKIDNWRIHRAKKGDILSLKKKTFGNRCYLAIKGGFKLEKWLNSSSTNLKAKVGGYMGRNLLKGDRLEFNQTKQECDPEQKLKIARNILPFYSNSPTIRITAGAEYEYLTALSELQFLKEVFTVSRSSDRMGFRLDGPPLHLLDKKEIVSSAVSFGTIQLLPSGQIVLLMSDHQTTGGYPRVAHVIEQDLPLVAQLTSSDKINFQLISLREAEESALRFEKSLSILKYGLTRADAS